MSKINLTTEQKTALELRHKKARDSRESDRIKSVLLRSEGWTIKMISQALRNHEASVVRHLNDYIEEEKLRPTNGGSASYLNEHQTQALISHITEHTYQYSYEIIAYIKQCWGIDYTVPGLHKWLHRNGFSYKQPKGVPHKTDLTKQADFIDYYEQLKSNLPEDERIVFMDAVHPTQATKVSCGWIKKGTDKTIETTGSRTRLNIIGGIELGHIAHAVTAQYKTINSESIIDFMTQLRHRSVCTGWVNLIVDGAGYHRAIVVAEAAKKLKIRLHFLPPYSPNLNPIERLWKVMNEKVRNNHYFHNAKAFREKIDEFFEIILPEIGDTLDSRINDNFQTFNPASSS